MARPSLTTMQTLLAIERLGTFTAAARYLNTTQSAISARMRQLEDRLGYSLFTRHGRTVQLTIPARELVERIEPLIAALDEVFDDAEVNDEPSGTIRIGLAEMSIGWFSECLVRLHSKMPRLQFAIDVNLSGDIQVALENGLLDIAVIANPKSTSTLDLVSLGRTSLSWVCAEFLLFDGKGSRRNAEQLLREELIWIPPSNSPSHTPARQELADMGVELKHVCTTSKGLAEIALSGAGVVLLPDTMVRSHIAAGRLVRVSEAPQTPDVELFLSTHRAHQEGVIQKVRDVILNVASETPP